MRRWVAVGLAGFGAMFAACGLSTNATTGGAGGASTSGRDASSGTTSTASGGGGSGGGAGVSTTSASGGGATTGSAGGAAVSGSASSSSSSAAGSSSSSSSGGGACSPSDPNSVCCPTDACAMGLKCCLNHSSPYDMHCSASCGPTEVQVSCDSAADCPGQICGGDVNGGTWTGPVQCRAACGASCLPICDVNAANNCPPGHGSCSPTPIQGDHGECF